MSSAQIAVVTYGQSKSEEGSSQVSLAREVELARSAVLYANRVRVISTAYGFNSMFSNALGSMETSPEHFVDFILHLAPDSSQIEGLPEAVRARDTLLETVDASERRRAQSMIRNFVQPFVEAQQLMGVSLLDKFVDQERFDELNQAARVGALSLEAPPNLGLKSIGDAMRGLALTVMEGREVDPDVLAPLNPLTRGLVTTLVELLDDPSVFPILDQEARQVIERGGHGETRRLAEARSRIGGAASTLLGQLPMADAPLGELLEIRHHLADYLGAFELRVGELAREVGPAQWEPGFEAEVAHLYTTRVEPEARDLEAKFDDVMDRFRTARRVRGLKIALATGRGLTEGWIASAIGQIPMGVFGQAIKHMLDGLSSQLDAELRTLKGNHLYYFVGSRELLAHSEVQ